MQTGGANEGGGCGERRRHARGLCTVVHTARFVCVNFVLVLMYGAVRCCLSPPLLYFAGDRILTPWLTVIGRGVDSGMPLVEVQLRRAGDELKGVRAQVGGQVVAVVVAGICCVVCSMCWFGCKLCGVVGCVWAWSTQQLCICFVMA